MTEIEKLKAELEKLKAENERLTNKVQSQHDYMAPKYDAAMAELEKLKAERDGPKVLTHEWLQSQASEDSTKPFDEMYSVLVSKEKEITRLTSQLDLYKAALEGMSEVDEDGFTSDGHVRCAERAAMVLRQAASQWIKDRQAKGEG